MIEYAKILIGLVAYLLVAPLLGFLMRQYRPGQIAAFMGMIVGTAFSTDHIMLTAFNVNHTGHTRGFEISFMVFCAIILVVAGMTGRWKAFRFCPPGFFFYALYCVAGTITLLLALPIPWPEVLVDLENGGRWVNAMYIWEAVVRFCQLGLVYLATHSFIRNKGDILWFCRAFALALIIVGIAALYDRYVGGTHKVRATFDHENSLGAWAYMGAMLCLAVSFHPKVGLWTSLFLFCGYGAGAVAAVLTVSRATAAIVGVLSLAIAGYGLIRNPSRKGALIGVCFLLAMLVGTYQYRDTIQERFLQSALADKRDREAETEDLRIVLNRQSKVMLKDSFLGIGWNNYQVACSRPVLRYSAIFEEHEAADGDKHAEETFYRNPTTECLYWYLLAETGYFGFFCYVAFMAVTLWLVFKAYLRYRGDWVGDFLFAALLVLGATYAHSWLEKVLLQSKNMVPWLALLGIAAKLETIRRVKNRRVQTEEAVTRETDTSPLLQVTS